MKIRKWKGACHDIVERKGKLNLQQDKIAVWSGVEYIAMLYILSKNVTILLVTYVASSKVSRRHVKQTDSFVWKKTQHLFCTC